jgi:hypothetical protein
MDWGEFEDFFKDTKTFIFILVIIILIAGLAIELIYIESILTPRSQADKCTSLCAESGRVAYLYGPSCYCKYPVNFEKNIHCFANASFSRSAAYDQKFNATSVRSIAVSSVTSYDKPNSIATRVFAIYNMISNKIVYVSDPRKDEYVASPLETWNIKGGDCDDMSILLASLYESVGLDTDLVEVYNDTYGHVFVIVRIEQDLYTFLSEYESLLEKYTPYSGDLDINLVIFENTENQCQAAREGLKSGNSMQSFYLIIESTAKNYAGGYDPVNDFKRINFFQVG